MPKGAITHTVRSRQVGVTTLSVAFATDGSGDPTTATDSGAGWSVARTATGIYKITLSNQYRSLDHVGGNAKGAGSGQYDLEEYASDVSGAAPYVTIATVRRQMLLDLLKIKVGTIFHGEIGTAVSTANASSEATAVALANALKTAYNAHCASAASNVLNTGAHIAADTNNTATSAAATDEASAITLANELKSDYNTHRAATTFHPTADSTNAVSSADASDAASLYTLLNEIKTDYNAHIAAGAASMLTNVVSGTVKVLLVLNDSGARSAT